MKLSSIVANKTIVESLSAVVLGLLVGFISVRISPLAVIGLLVMVIALFIASRFLQINVLNIITGCILGFAAFAVFYLTGNIHFISSVMYNLVTLILFIGFGVFLILPDFRTEMMFFMLFKPFWDYLETKHIFYLNFNEIYFQFEALFILGWLLKYLLVRKKNHTRHSYDFYLYILFTIILGSSLLSIIFSHDMIRAANGVIYGVVAPFILYVIIKGSVQSTDKLFGFMRVLNDVLLIHNLFTIFVEYSGQTFFNIVNYHSRATGLFGNSGTVTLLQVFIIPVTFYVIDQGKKIDKFMGILGLLVEIIMVLLTASRAGFVLVLMYLLMYFLMNNQRALKMLSAALVALPVIYVLFKRFFGSTYSVFLLKITSIFSDSSRSHYLEKTFDLLFSNIVNFFFNGVGIDNYFYEYQNSIGSEAVYSAHNFFLNMAIEIGLLGALAFLAIFIMSIMYSLIKGNKLKQVPLMIFSGIFIYSLISGFGVCRFGIDLDVNFVKINFFSILLWMALGMNVVILRLSQKDPEEKVREGQA